MHPQVILAGALELMPGEVSLAHNGVRFLDARPECRRHVLEVLRQPLDEGVVCLQSHGRPRSQCFRSLSYTAHDVKNLGLSTVVTHHHRDGHRV